MRARWKVQRPDVDPWGLVLALASLGVFVLHGFEAALGRDLGLYAYSGQRVAAGEAPYEAVLNRAGPFGHLVNGAGALVARMLHTDDIVTMRWTMTFLTVATVWVLYVVGRDLLDSKLAGVVTAVTFLRFRELLEFATGGPREKPTMLLLVALALLAVTHRRWAVAGVMVALATLTWQPAFFLGAPAAVGALLVLPGREVLRGVLRFAAGGIATTAVVGAIMWIWGAWHAFLECFLLINLRYTSQSTGIEIIRADPARFYSRFLDLVLLVTGLVSVIAFALVRIRRSNRQDQGLGAQMGLGLAAFASMAWALLFALQGWGDLMVLTPLAALGVATLVQGAVALFDGEAPEPRGRSLGATGVAVLCLAAVAAAGWTSYSTRSHDLVLQRAQVSAVLAAAPAGATVASIEAPQALALGHKANPNRYQMFTNGLDEYFQESFPGGLAGIRRLLESEQPTLLVCSCGRETEIPGKHAFVRPLLDAEYTKVGTGWHFSWYARNSLGETAIRRLREAARLH